MKFFLILVLQSALLFISCSEHEEKIQADNNTGAQKSDEAGDSAPPESIGISESANKNENSNTLELKVAEAGFINSAFEYEGELVKAVSWKDKNGDNFLILSSSFKEWEEKAGEYEMYYNSAGIFARHYADENGSFKLLREIKDFEKECEFDNMAGFIEESLTLSDIDKDGYGEVTFIYNLGCASDVSPNPAKLMLLENGDKYPVRGYTLIEYAPGDLSGGEMEAGKEFQQAPVGFKEQAEKIWKKYTYEQVYTTE